MTAAHCKTLFQTSGNEATEMSCNQRTPYLSYIVGGVGLLNQLIGFCWFCVVNVLFGVVVLEDNIFSIEQRPFNTRFTL